MLSGCSDLNSLMLMKRLIGMAGCDAHSASVNTAGRPNDTRTWPRSGMQEGLMLSAEALFTYFQV